MGSNSGIAFLGIFGLTITILAFFAARGLEKVNEKERDKTKKKKKRAALKIYRNAKRNPSRFIRSMKHRRK